MFKQMLENKIGEKLTTFGINQPSKQAFEWMDKFRQSLDATTEKLQAQFTRNSSNDETILNQLNSNQPPQQQQQPYQNNQTQQQQQPVQNSMTNGGGRKALLKTEKSIDEDFGDAALFNTDPNGYSPQPPVTPPPISRARGSLKIGSGSVKGRKLPTIQPQNSLQVSNYQDDESSSSSFNDLSNHSSSSLKHIDQSSSHQSSR